MPTRPFRREIGIIDVMIFVAATAVAVAATRREWPDYFDIFRPDGLAHHVNWPHSLYMMRHLLYSASYFTATWSLSCLICGLRRPRGAIRSVLRQPGLVACLTATVVLGLRMTTLAATLSIQYVYQAKLYDYDLREMFDATEELPLIPSEVGCAIAAAWVVQWASGRWRPEASWIDRLGRALGFLWIATLPFSYFSWGTHG